MKKVPLPFVGNKGRYISFQEVIQNIPDYITDVYDLFGGSFFCGYLVKALHPHINVHINKYATNYLDRLHKFNRTKPILEKLRSMITAEKFTKLDLNEAMNVKKYLSTLSEDEDWLSICCYICYKTNNMANTKEELMAKKYSQYYNLIPNDLNIVVNAIDKYLKVLSKCDFFECDYFDFKYTQNPYTTLYILDPPYINTINNTYQSIEEKKLLSIFNEIFTNKNLIYFGSDKNEMFNELEKMNLKDINIIKTLRKNSHVLYYDIMVVKWI